MRRSFFAPEYHQISTMDCGVGALSAFLRGYGLDPSYERLRQACQTSIDGTSIESLEELSLELGLEVEQHLLPRDLLLAGLRGRWPAIAVVENPGRSLHFVTLWRRLGSDWVHWMDPGQGRVWERKDTLERSLYSNVLELSHEDWPAWFATSSFRVALRERVAQLMPRDRVPGILDLLDSGHAQRVSCAEASLRLVAQAQTKQRGTSATWRAQLYDNSFAATMRDPAALPLSMWALEATGNGMRVISAVALAASEPDWEPASRTGGGASSAAVEHEVLRATEEHRSVWRDLYGLLSSRSRALVLASVFATIVVGAGTACELVIVRAASFDAASMFPVATSRASVAGFVVSLFVVVTCLQVLLAVASRRIGQELELRLRELTFLMLPRVDDTFVRTRPTGDLAYRAHGLELGRQFPRLVFSSFNATVDIVFTVAALTWIRPSHFFILVVGALALWAMTSLMQNRFREIDTRFQAHGSRLMSIFLDVLRGFRPVRLHGYQPAFRAEQDHELGLWHETGVMQAGTRALLQLAQTVFTTVWLGAIFWNEASHADDARTFVIVAFWMLRLPGAIDLLVSQSQQFTPARAAFARLLEILRYARPPESSPAGGEDVEPPTQREGVSLHLANASVVVGGHALLRGVNLQIPAGQHVAIVGASGSGKSTLVSLILGFYSLADGSVTVDGEALDAERARRLREQTAWVDPAVQLWNGTFLENLEYAASGYRHRDLLGTLDASDLLGVLNGMDRGLDTEVGGEGRLLSGGEGQRLRLGRALLRRDVRLAVFDEAFRGLDRTTRKRLALRARLALQSATMLFVSHDIAHALDFDRVLVVDNGEIVEDGHPLELSSRPSAFARLLEAERDILAQTWAQRHWRRVRVASGRLIDEEGA